MLTRLNGFPLIVVATAVAGIAGFVITILVRNEVSPAGYTIFMIFWGALYLVVGGLNGVQQEVTRSTHLVPFGERTGPSRARNFGVVLAVLVALAVLGSAVFWVDAVFPTVGWPMVWPLAVAAGSYVLVATLSGSLYGVSQWRSLALMIGVDGLLRLALLIVALMFTQDVVALAWVAALPFPLAIMLLWPVIRPSFVGRSALDVGYRALSWNVARVVFASVSTAVLVSGFPLLLGVSAHGESEALKAELIFTITLARAPLVVTVMALQSYLIVRFRDDVANRWRNFVAIQAVVLGGGAVVALFAWLLGPWAFGVVSAKPVTLDGGFMAVLVASSALVGALCVSASAVLARSQHFVFSLGWVMAALVTIALMVSPLEFVPRVLLALLIGPVAGLLVHVSWLVINERAAATGKTV